MDEYLKLYTKNKTRTVCCKEQLKQHRQSEGFFLFKKLLIDRGNHYKTTYTLLIDSKEYKGKHKKYPIRCESHDILFYYSMKDLNYNTSCPCSMCRIDINHKNKSVEIVQKRNNGRPGLIRRHALNVKKKYGFKCALSHSTFDLHYHHLDGQDFYTQLQNSWQHNGICLCSPIHRDYHFNFLLNISLIAKHYDSQSLNLSQWGDEVSRYTFLEYLKFLKFDLKMNNASYVTLLNEKCLAEQSSFPLSDHRFGVFEKITLKKVEKAIKKFCCEYKGENWAYHTCTDIPYANDLKLWRKVDFVWQC